MYRPLVLLFVAGALFAQDAALTRLKREAAQAKALNDGDAEAKEEINRVAILHLALRDWIESRLPRNKVELGAKSGSLESTMKAELSASGLSAPTDAPPAEGPEGPGFGYVDIDFSWPRELPDVLVVTATAKVICGEDQAIYGYRFTATGRMRVLEDHKHNSWFGEAAKLVFSELDPEGGRLLLIRRYSTQCASFWMGMNYSVYRLHSSSGDPKLLFYGEHGFYLNLEGPLFRLLPSELLIEFLDHSVDFAVHNRTQIHRYNFIKGVRRLDPVALQPQDFAEEWLTRPWSEMQFRSTPATEAWHAKLHNESVSAEYGSVLHCTAKPGRWVISLWMKTLGDKILDEPFAVHFLVRDFGKYRYQMEAVSESPPSGCPIDGLPAEATAPSDKHPWLSEAELTALPPAPPPQRN